MVTQVQEKSMVPTVLVGVGGTGKEVLLRTRRLIEESYGSLDKFPIVSFLWVDTDKDYKTNEPDAAGSSLKENEKYWASVTGEQVNHMMTNMGQFPWINAWFPEELERNMGALVAGAGQIRACGRFAFFYNYHNIRGEFNEACKRIKGHDTYMQETYGIKVESNGLNVFIAGSLSGGTGSGMLLDLGYCIRHWLQGVSNPSITAIMPMPNAFASIQVGDRVLANGYAALMELSYFSDHRTEYVAQFSQGLVDEVRSTLPPFDFTYLVGTQNGKFDLDQLREMIAQNIFLDLTSDFAPHKKSIRDNMKGSWSTSDPGGRGYPRNFMSFGLATFEVPMAQIRANLVHRLAADLVRWWINDSVDLMPMIVEQLRTGTLKTMRLTEAELLSDLASSKGNLLITEMSAWVNSIRREIASEDKLQCTFQGANLLGPEKGKILEFVDYLKAKVDGYRNENLRDLDPNEKVHGAFLQAMYNNRDRIVQAGKRALEQEFYRIIEDRNRGPKFAAAFITNTRQIFANAAEKFQHDAERIYQPNEKNRERQYSQALIEITETRTSFGITKQAQMERLSAQALSGLEGALNAFVQNKARTEGLKVIERLQDCLNQLEQRLAQLNTTFAQLRGDFTKAAQQDANRAEALEINGIKLYDKEELNHIYNDLIECQVSEDTGVQRRFDAGLGHICSIMTPDILKVASPLWKDQRQVDEVMQLLDITQLPQVSINDFRSKILDRVGQVIAKAPQASRLNQDLVACDRLFKLANNNEQEISQKIGLVYEKSQPLLDLSQATLMAAGFNAPRDTRVALLGGIGTANPAAMKLIPHIQTQVGKADAISPLGEQERHRIVFVQEIGGFSLRSVNGMDNLRTHYQNWKGQMIMAKRAQLRGEAMNLPIPVHTDKRMPFWDFAPEDDKVYQLVVLARALGVLQLVQHQKTKEDLVRYVQSGVIGDQNVDIASSWVDAVQVLAVAACRPDREEIQRQVNKILTSAESPEQKAQCYQQFMTYLEQREGELHRDGGKDSPEYKREAAILRNTIEQYSLKVDVVISPPPVIAPISPIMDPPRPLDPVVVPPNSGVKEESYAQFEQDLKQLANLNIPVPTFLGIAKEKAASLGLDSARVQTILKKFVKQTEPDEEAYRQCLSELVNQIPANHFEDIARVKALEMGIEIDRAKLIWNAFLKS